MIIIGCGLREIKRSWNGIWKKVLENSWAYGISRDTGRKIVGRQKKRLSIASALSNQASLLIMDEPGAALDLEAKEEILTYIRNYLKNGGTVILTSHETQELSICTQLFVMKKGLLMPVTEKLSAAELVLLF